MHRRTSSPIPGVDVIVELMGGDEPARTLIAAALAAGKAVVTANKHVVAHHGPQLEAIAREHGGTLRFEASVGGGTPVLTPLAEGLAADDVLQVRGIVNGTTNFILTSMREQGSAYADALAEAQARGYAEADPRGDVEGDDAVNKAVILARLAFGAWIAPADVLSTPPTLRGAGHPGVTGVTAEEVAAAGALGLTLKLIALAEIGPDGRPTASVLPSAMDRAGPFGRTDWVLNRIEVVADPVGTVAFSGPGAGGDATSSAVLGDLVALARGQGSTWAGLPPAGGTPSARGRRSGIGPTSGAPRRRGACRAAGRPERHGSRSCRESRPRRSGPRPGQRSTRRRTSRAARRSARGRSGLPPRGPRSPRRPDCGRDALPRGGVITMASGSDIPRPRLLERYRAFLPLTDSTPIVFSFEASSNR